MRLEELNTRDHQLDELNVGKAVTGVARGVGKAVGGVAKGIGAVAGGIAGIPGAIKKGYQAGKAVVSGNDQPAQQPGAAGGTQVQPAASGTQGQQQGGALSSFKQGLQQPLGGGKAQQAQKPAADDSAAQTSATDTVQEPSQSQSTAAEPATQDQTAAAAQPADDVTALRDRILKLDDASRQDIIKSLQTHINPPPIPKGSYNKENRNYGLGKESTGNFIYPGQKFDTGTGDPIAQPGSKQPAASDQAAGAPSQPTADQPQGGMPAGRFGQETGRLAKPLAGADSETPGAALPQKTAGNRPQGGGRVAGQLSTNPRAVKRREQRAAKKTAGEAPSAGAAQPDLTDPNVPISAAIRQRQAQGLAAGYRNPNKMIREGFSLFRKQQ